MTPKNQLWGEPDLSQIKEVTLAVQDEFVLYTVSTKLENSYKVLGMPRTNDYYHWNSSISF
jgi:hypothetical protein